MTADGSERFEIVRAGLFLGMITTNYEFARRCFPTSTFTCHQRAGLWLVQVQFDDEISHSLQAKEVT